jgi:hypothetical protein
LQQVAKVLNLLSTRGLRVVLEGQVQRVHLVVDMRIEETKEKEKVREGERRREKEKI